jgi:tetratricopeptide (TPR) repeat protein
LRLARYWEADGDLDEAVGPVRQALCLVRRHPGAPVALAVEVAVTAARIERDRDNPAAGRAALTWAVELLDATPAGADRDRLLSRVLVDLGDCHRRAGRYPPAIEALNRARRLVDTAGAAGPVQVAALHTALGIVAKETGAFDRAAHCYATVGRLLGEAGAAPADAASLQHNLAGLAYARQRYAQAESHARRAVALRRQAPGATKVDVAADIAVLAAAIAGQHRHDEAHELFTQAMTALPSGPPAARLRDRRAPAQSRRR